VGPTDAAQPEAEIDGTLGKGVVVLLAGEALLFGGRDQPAVTQERRGCVVEVAGDAEDVHLGLPARARERSARALGPRLPTPRAATAERQRVGAPAHSQREGRDDREEEGGKEDPC